MSYKSFSKKVLGEKIINKTIENNKVIRTYLKNKNGEYERDFGINRIFSLDNTLLIVDEAHNITNNDWGNALKQIIEKSKNLRIILMTATPMKNLADEIVELLNFLKPINNQLDKDKIFNYVSESNKRFTGNKLELKKDGLKYLKNNSGGLISHYRGNNPLLFAKQVNIGEIPKELFFTSLIRCEMLEFQEDVLKKIKLEKLDKLDKNMIAAANFVFPILNNEKTKIIGDYSKLGLDRLFKNIKNELYLDLLYEKFFKNENVKLEDKKKIIYE